METWPRRHCAQLNSQPLLPFSPAGPQRLWCQDCQGPNVWILWVCKVSKLWWFDDPKRPESDLDPGLQYLKVLPVNKKLRFTPTWQLYEWPTWQPCVSARSSTPKKKHFPCHEHRPLLLFGASLAKEAKSAPLKPSASLAKVDKSSGFRKKLNASPNSKTGSRFLSWTEGKTTSSANGNLKSSVVRCRWERHLSCVFFFGCKGSNFGRSI